MSMQSVAMTADSRLPAPQYRQHPYARPIHNRRTKTQRSATHRRRCRQTRTGHQFAVIIVGYYEAAGLYGVHAARKSSSASTIRLCIRAGASEVAAGVFASFCIIPRKCSLGDKSIGRIPQHAQMSAANQYRVISIGCCRLGRQACERAMQCRVQTCCRRSHPRFMVTSVH
jgi:hypothetical protein